jgi:hypothetical protein
METSMHEPSSTSTSNLLATTVFADSEWQMHYGERFALEGLLATLRPALSIEIGRAEGGSLRRIAAHSGQVHSFDLVPESDELRAAVENVTFHTGDSSVQVPETLAELAAAGRTVDFALVDGDHSADGVKRDALALLDSPACRNTTIVFHDAANDVVRAGLEAVGFPDHPRVLLSLLDFVPGFVVEHGVYEMQIWNGLGLVVLGDGREGPAITEPYRYDSAELQRRIRDILVAGEAPAPEPAPVVAPPPAERSKRRLAIPGLVTGAAVAGAIAGWAGSRARR